MRSTEAAVATKSPPSPITIVLSSRTPSISLQRRSGLIGERVGLHLGAHLLGALGLLHAEALHPLAHAGLPPRAMPSRPR
jgi:hypothetical protein